MTSHDVPQLGFFDAVQIFFTQVTGRGVMLGGRDIEYLDLLHRRGVDARLVCQAVAEAVEQMADEDPPRNIWACRPWIDAYLERASVGSVGAHPPDRPAPDTSPTRPPPNEADQALLEQALESIEAAGRSAHSEAIRDVYRRAWRDIHSLAAAPSSNPLEALAAVEDAMVDAFFGAMLDAERQRIERQLLEQQGPHLRRMTEAARARHLRARRRRLLIEQHGLVSLLD